MVFAKRIATYYAAENLHVAWFSFPYRSDEMWIMLAMAAVFTPRALAFNDLLA